MPTLCKDRREGKCSHNPPNDVKAETVPLFLRYPTGTTCGKHAPRTKRQRGLGGIVKSGAKHADVQIEGVPQPIWKKRTSF